jgi:hypothetical protein
MSTRAIGAVVGVSNKTVHQDQRSLSLVTQVTPDPDGEPQGAPKASPVAKQAEQPPHR